MVNQILVSAVVALLTFWGTFQIYGRLVPTQPVEIGSVTLEDTIQAIKRELAEIASTPGETAGLVLQVVKVELAAQRAKTDTTTAQLAVPVFEEASLTAKTEAQLTRGSKMTVVFVAPSGQELLAEGEPAVLDLSALVLAARRGLLATQAEGADLAPKSVEIEVSFVLVRSAEGGAAFKAYVIDIGGTASQVETVGNKIVLNYVNPELLAHNQADAVTHAPIPPK